jgi:hypothetical protein
MHLGESLARWADNRGVGRASVGRAAMLGVLSALLGRRRGVAGSAAVLWQLCWSAYISRTGRAVAGCSKGRRAQGATAREGGGSCHKAQAARPMAAAHRRSCNRSRLDPPCRTAIRGCCTVFAHAAVLLPWPYAADSARFPRAVQKGKSPGTRLGSGTYIAVPPAFFPHSRGFASTAEPLQRTPPPLRRHAAPAGSNACRLSKPEATTTRL